LKAVLIRAVAIEAALLVLIVLSAQAQKAPPDLTSLQIEDLMNVSVTSASKKEQKLSNVPAAIFLITKEDVSRSGATSLPDLLRMAPGLEVAQINPSVWAVSARGFNGQYSDKLLVLIDGRTVYTPIFSGVFWDAQDVPLDLIERIEIIRGPGAAVWGTNAVNGVINIITKTAQATQGGLATGSGGTLDHGSGMLRFGAPIGGRGAFRVFADGFEMGHFLTPAHQNAEDDWHLSHGGFRVDADVSSKDSLTVEGETLRGNSGELATAIVTLLPPVNATYDLRNIFSGWSVLGRWKRVMPGGSESSLQVYFDRSNRGNTGFSLGLNTVDLDFQEHMHWTLRQDLVWGLGFRNNSDHTAGTWGYSFTPSNLSTRIFNAFVQDEIAVRPNRLSFSLGTKLEHAYYNGFNLEPTARLTWTPSDGGTWWAAISAAQRTPSRVETAIRFNPVVYPGPNNLPAVMSVFGNPNKKNERLTATEAGFRKQLSTMLSFDVAAFFNHYSDLTSEEPGPPFLETTPAPPHLVVPFYFGSLLHGETHGLEMFAEVKLSSRWTVSPGYTFLNIHLHPDAASMDTTTAARTRGDSPTQQAQLRSQVNLARDWQWNTSISFVGPLFDPKIPSYTRLDSNLAWQLSDNLSLRVAGQNLLPGLHQEYDGPDLTELPSLVRRSGYAKLTWRF
jgi:iron complex outermembrane receptor protein